MKTSEFRTRLSDVIIKSFSIYEVKQICIDSRRYPRRKISLHLVGFFNTKENAEEAIRQFITREKECYAKYDEDYYANCRGYFIREHRVYNRLDTSRHRTPQRAFSYTADGELNDFIAMYDDSDGCVSLPWGFCGRRPEDIRFKVGDIVEVVDYNTAELAIVGGLPLTTDKYRQMQVDEECEYPNQFIDESDDCYLVYSLDKNDSHYHPACYKVFRPDRKISQSIMQKLKQKLKQKLSDITEMK